MKPEPICFPFDLTRSTKKPMSLASGNEMISANDRIHFRVRAELTNHLRELSNLTARQYLGERTKETPIYSKEKPCHIVVHICPPSKRSMDTPNWYPTVKALVDGLTDAGIWDDDNDKVITSFTFLPGEKTSNKKYRIIIEIREGYF